MTAQILEHLRAFYSEGTGREHTSHNQRVVHSVEDSLAIAPPLERLERRQDPRTACTDPCSYELLEPLDAQSVLIQRGEAFIMNRSANGMVLLLGISLHPHQLLEVHTSDSTWRQTLSLLEVLWALPIPIESHGTLYKVGGRITFGPYHYWQL